MSSEVEVTGVIVQLRKFRHTIPEKYRATLDTRLQWLWMQRFGTVQTIWQHSPDVEDNLACTIVMQAIVGADLNNITLLFKRLEGGAQGDENVLDGVLTI